MLDLVSDHKDCFLKNKSEYEFYFVASVPEYNKIYFEDRYIITGHTPTGFINENYIGKIYQKNRHIAIDCGAVSFSISFPKPPVKLIKVPRVSWSAVNRKLYCQEIILKFSNYPCHGFCHYPWRIAECTASKCP